MLTLGEGSHIPILPFLLHLYYFKALNFRRWSRRLTLFFKIVNNLTPLYSKEPIPLLHWCNYSLRNQDVIGRVGARTEKFQSSFYPHCLAEWNELDPELRHAPSVTVFKKKLLSIIRPPCKICLWDLRPSRFILSYSNQSWSKQIKPPQILT